MSPTENTELIANYQLDILIISWYWSCTNDTLAVTFFFFIHRPSASMLLLDWTLSSLSNFLFCAAHCPAPPPHSSAFLHLLMSFPVSVVITVFTVSGRKPNKLTLHCSGQSHYSWKHQHSDSFLKPHINKQRPAVKPGQDAACNLPPVISRQLLDCFFKTAMLSFQNYLNNGNSPW